MKKFKVSIIGYGYWGPKLARNFQNSNFFNLFSIIDISKKNLMNARRDFPLAKIGTDYKLSLNKSNISLVVISTPTKTHFKIAKYALEKKINVLVEKPLSLSIKEVKILENLAKINKVLLFVDYPFLFSGSVKYIKKLIDNKKFGNLIEIESFRELAPIRKDCNVVWDLTVHDISILHFLLNRMPYRYESRKFKTVSKNQADTAYLSLSYKNNINVFLKNTWISPSKIRLIKFKFKKAIVHCDENEPIYKIKIFKKKQVNNNEYNLEVPDLDLSEPLSVLVNYIYKSLSDKRNNIFNNNLNLNITKILKKLC
tara:strand:+ start:1054 stop:1989 length:936 start_codon:yes stop_codon:yes gene_type:complete